MDVLLIQIQGQNHAGVYRLYFPAVSPADSGAGNQQYPLIQAVQAGAACGNRSTAGTGTGGAGRGTQTAGGAAGRIAADDGGTAEIEKRAIRQGINDNGTAGTVCG